MPPPTSLCLWQISSTWEHFSEAILRQWNGHGHNAKVIRSCQHEATDTDNSSIMKDFMASFVCVFVVDVKQVTRGFCWSNPSVGLWAHLLEPKKYQDHPRSKPNIALFRLKGTAWTADSGQYFVAKHDLIQSKVSWTEIWGPDNQDRWQCSWGFANSHKYKSCAEPVYNVLNGFSGDQM